MPMKPCKHSLHVSALLLAMAAALGLCAARLSSGEPRGTQTLSLDDQPLPLFDTPEAALLVTESPPTLNQTSRLSLSYRDGAAAPQGQVYVRPVYEEDGVIHTSPYALVFNFKPGQTASDLSLRELLDLDSSRSYTMAQLELISYWGKGRLPSDYQFALARLE